jgi:hypothetical protein
VDLELGVNWLLAIPVAVGFLAGLLMQSCRGAGRRRPRLGIRLPIPYFEDFALVEDDVDLSLSFPYSQSLSWGSFNGYRLAYL